MPATAVLCPRGLSQVPGRDGTKLLQGAGLTDVFMDIISHSADVNAPDVPSGSARTLQNQAAPKASDAAWSVQISPCQSGDSEHSCTLCPPTLCKGMWVNALAVHHPRIVFCGDGANDLCPVLCLRPCDVALVREGYACHKLIEERRAHGDEMQQPRCGLQLWRTHTELANLMRRELRL